MGVESGHWGASLPSNLLGAHFHFPDKRSCEMAATGQLLCD
jgi:hypothetical protein